MEEKKTKVAKITLYEGINFKGRSKTFTEANDNMMDAGFFDCASSVIVEGGVWALYEHNYYRGEICVVVEGDRVNLVAGQKDKDTKIFDFNNRVSSLKPLEFDCTGEPKITIYEGDFNSRKLEFTEDVLDLRWYNMNDKVSYIKVQSGGWIGFTAVGFRGAQTLFLPGDHRMTSSDGVFRNDQYSSFRALQTDKCYPLILDRIEYHLDRATRQETPMSIFSWTQTNDSKITQKLSIQTEKVVTTEDSYEFTWEQGTKISAELEVKTEVPLVASSSYKLSIEASYNVGSAEGRNTSKTEQWSVHFPSEIPPESEIQLESTLTQGKIDVPFTAYFHQGKKEWTEKGTYKGTQYYGLATTFTEVPIDKD